MNEVREAIASLFDYCGDSKNNVTRNYSAGYSPNNIKSVVFSPEGVLVRLHLGYDGSLPKGIHRLSSKILYIQFSPIKLYAQDKDGKMDLGTSFYKMVVSPLVCASIEEILILNGVSNPALQQYTEIMRSYDLDKKDLLLGYQKSDNLDKDISSRFTRLSRITESSLCFLQFFIALRGQNNTKLVDKLTFYEFIGGRADASTEYNFDWWNGIKLQTNTYLLDNKLLTRFNSVKDLYSKMLKDAEVKNFKEKMYKKDIEEVNKCVERYVGLCKLPLILRKVNGVASNGLGNPYPIIPVQKIVPYEGMVSGVDKGFIDEANKLPIKDALAKNKELANSLSELASLTSKAFIDSLYNVFKTAPLTYNIMAGKIKYVLNSNTVPIIIPSDCVRLTSEMTGSLAFDSELKSVSKSIVNAIWLYSVCFVDDSKYREKSYWENLLRKGR